MPAIASSFLFSLGLAAVSPTPTPTATEAPNLPSVPISVKVIRSRAADVRATSSGAVQCVPLPTELARPAEPPLPSRVPAYTSIAGTGKTLGLLFPKTEKGHPLSLFTRGRPTGSYVLKPPPVKPSLPPSPLLALGEEGSYAALAGREGFAVYVNGVLTGLVDREAGAASVAFRFGEVMWCPWPRRPSGARGVSLAKLFKEGEEPPLWLRAELDGSSPQALARLDVSRLDPNHPNPVEWAMGIATRRDGKLWLVGLCSGEVWLATPSGRILRREVLPVRLRSEEDDDAAMKALEEETLREARSQPGIDWADPARRQPKSVEIVVGGRARVVRRVMARDNDLVVTTLAADPARAIIYVPADGGPAHCWTVPGQGELLSVAVTDQALWWVGNGETRDGHLFYAPWDELLPPEASAAEEPPPPEAAPPR